MENIKVEKRDGPIESIDVEKIHKVITWAAEGLDVSVSQVEMKSHIQFFDGIKTKAIHEMIVKTAADLISEREPDYQFLASRLELFSLRKEVFGKYEPDCLYDLVVKNTKNGKYDKHILEDYSKEELDEINSFMDHDRDLQVAHAGMQQLKKKYLVQNRVTGEIYETPQFIYALVGACLFSKYPKESRLSWVKRFYDASSLGKISLPTPIMAGIRTPTRQFSSCVLIESGDSLDEINATNSAIVKYISQRAGIGVNFGMIRGLGANIRGGEAFHTGVIPFLKTFQASVKSCSQGAIRSPS